MQPSNYFSSSAWIYLLSKINRSFNFDLITSLVTRFTTECVKPRRKKLFTKKKRKKDVRLIEFKLKEEEKKNDINVGSFKNISAEEKEADYFNEFFIIYIIIDRYRIIFLFARIIRKDIITISAIINHVRICII